MTICDVGPRDGLQNDDVVLEPLVRAELVDRLSAVGLPRIEAVSFVNPRACRRWRARRRSSRRSRRSRGSPTPASSSTSAATTASRRRASPRRTSRSPSSDEFNQRNSGSSTEASVVAGERVVERAKADGIRVTVTFGTSFGCPFEGAIDPGRVLELASRFAAGGADELVFADTVGVGVPRQVRHLVG